MSQFLKKIHCPSGTHEDNTPSCAVYSTGSGYCFSCNQHFPKVEGVSVVNVTKPKEKEDLTSKFEYIDSLPVIVHRNIPFPHDARGYYVVWPNRDYYKMRLWAPKAGEPKYIGSKGHQKPWFIIKGQFKTRTLILVEGEINALSLNQASVTDWADVISPGGASNFFDSAIKSNLDYFLNYDKIIIIVDGDKAGTEGAIKFKSLVQEKVLDITIILMPKGEDLNEILVTYGKEEFKQKVLEMCGRL